jgi:hypothetical protein
MFVVRKPRTRRLQRKIFLAIEVFDAAKSAYHFCIGNLLLVLAKSPCYYMILPHR